MRDADDGGAEPHAQWLPGPIERSEIDAAGDDVLETVLPRDGIRNQSFEEIADEARIAAGEGHAPEVRWQGIGEARHRELGGRVGRHGIAAQSTGGGEEEVRVAGGS